MSHQPLVRIAEIEIDPARIDEYKALLAGVMERSMALEPGVLSLSAASLSDAPPIFRVFEVYRDGAAYQDHLQTDHFRAYKAKVETIVRALVLHEAGWSALPGKPQP